MSASCVGSGSSLGSGADTIEIPSRASVDNGLYVYCTVSVALISATAPLALSVQTATGEVGDQVEPGVQASAQACFS
jgi:hypothetical protein